MTTPLTADRHIIINMPKSKQKQPSRVSGCYEENRKEMQVEKVQQVLLRYRQERGVK